MLNELLELPIEINNYVFNKFLGSGAYSCVYEVMSQKYQKTFAAKVTPIDSSVMDDDGLLVDAELNALIAIDHPHVIRIYDFFEHEGYLVLILEFCSGGTIQDFLSHKKSFSGEQIRIIGSEIVDALVFCHSQSIAHRDIKPSNIFIDAYGRSKVADFNLSAILSPKQLINSPAGSYQFVAPEVLLNEAYDPYKADVWSLGITFYHMHAGFLPWSEDCVKNNERSMLSFPKDFDYLLKSLIEHMVVEDPSKRYSMIDVFSDNFFKFTPRSSSSHRPFIKCTSNHGFTIQPLSPKGTQFSKSIRSNAVIPLRVKIQRHNSLVIKKTFYD